jgi:acyl-CoA synthetase (NDP forming)
MANAVQDLQAASGSVKSPGHALDRLFHARSVALLGISGDTRKMTGAPLEILQQAGFTGRIYPVNPKYPELAGLRCYADIADLPEAPDVALIMLAARHVPAAIRACAARGTHCAVVLSAGFEETPEGEAHARELAAAAAESGVLVVGPNCEGLWSVPDRLLLTFGSAARRKVLHTAPIAVLSQSGAMAGAIARHLQNNELGCAYVVSVGNETVLTIADYLEWMVERDDVRVVALFIEGLRDGQRLLRALEQARRKGLHVVALKTGNTAGGQKAAASHTGKMASDYNVYHDLLDEAGVIQVHSLTELIEATEVLAVSPSPASRGPKGGVSVFSIPGGTRAMTVDLCDENDVPLAEFTPATRTALAEALPTFGGVDNPTDLTGQVLSEPGLFDHCLHILAQDPNTEALVVQVANRGPHDVQERIELLSTLADQTKLPMVVSFLGDTLAPAPKAVLRARGVLCARDPAEAARFLGWLYQARRHAARPPFKALTTTQTVASPESWPQTAAFLRDACIAVPAWRIVGAGDDGQASCADLTFPVVAKALPDEVDHKTELGLVVLGIATPADLAEQVRDLRTRMGCDDAPVLVQEMVKGGVEVLVSALRNPDFGPVLAIGMGGIAVELHRDVAYLALPTDATRVRRSLESLRLWQLLQGFRGRPAMDVEALVQAVVTFGDRFVMAQPALDELEINPLFVGPAGSGMVTAVDALVRRG